MPRELRARATTSHRHFRRSARAGPGDPLLASLVARTGAAPPLPPHAPCRAHREAGIDRLVLRRALTSVVAGIPVIAGPVAHLLGAGHLERVARARRVQLRALDVVDVDEEVEVVVAVAVEREDARQVVGRPEEDVVLAVVARLDELPLAAGQAREAGRPDPEPRVRRV